MRTHLSVTTTLLVLAAAPAFAAETPPAAPPQPAGRPAADLPPAWLRDDRFEVKVDGRAVAAHTGFDRDLGSYAFAGFDMAAPAQVTITGPCDMEKAVIRPAGVKFSAKGRELTLTMDKPCQISIEPDGLKGPLLLFANPPAKAPEASPTVIRLGPGIHRPKDGKIVLTDNQTLWLDDGAVLLGTVQARGAKNVHIAGRGIIDGSSWGWQKGPSRFLVHFHDCQDSGIEGVTLRNSFFWTTCIVSCRNFKVENAKIMGGRFVNDDGIDICNSQKVEVKDCFIRTYDDSVSIKGIPFKVVTRAGYLYNWPPARDKEPVEDVDVHHCVFWGGPCRVVEIGPECQATHMKRIKIRDSDVLHYHGIPSNKVPTLMFEVGEQCHFEDIVFSDLRIHLDACPKLIEIHASGTTWQTVKGPAFVDGVKFKNIAFTGVTDQKVILHGGDAKHMINGVVFENVTLNGQPLGPVAAPRFDVNKYVGQVLVVAEQKGPAPVAQPQQLPEAAIPAGLQKYAWCKPRFEAQKKLAKTGGFEVMLLGDSITQLWANEGKGPMARVIAPHYTTGNFGTGGDRTQHVLWRLDNGCLEGALDPKVIVLMIGRNNPDAPEDTVAGVRAIIARLDAKLPKARILLMAVLPARDGQDPIHDKINHLLPALADGQRIRFLDIGDAFLKGGKPDPRLFSDKVHLSPAGYQRWAQRLVPALDAFKIHP